HEAAEAPTFIIDRCDAPRDRSFASVFGDEATTLLHTARLTLAERPGRRIGERGTRLRVNESENVDQFFPSRFLLRPADQVLGGAIEDAETPLGIADDDRVADGPERGGEPALHRAAGYFHLVLVKRNLDGGP